MKYLGLDTETFGFEGTDIASVYFGIYDENFDKLKELNLFIKPDNNIYRIDPEAIKYNKIDLLKHHYNVDAFTHTQAKASILKFLQHNTDHGEEKFNLIGHNIHFDINKLDETDVIKRRIFEKYIDRRYEDTSCIAKFLIGCEVISAKSSSLRDLCEYFEIVNPNPHTADADVWTTIEVYKNMKNIILNMKEYNDRYEDLNK